MARRMNRTYRPAAVAAHVRALSAQRELLSSQEVPMHRYPHPIPRSAPGTVPPAPESPAAATQALEQLACQSQLLVDLLGAVNSLTAAVLCQKDKS